MVALVDSADRSAQCAEDVGAGAPTRATDGAADAIGARNRSRCCGRSRSSYRGQSASFSDAFVARRRWGRQGVATSCSGQAPRDPLPVPDPGASAPGSLPVSAQHGGCQDVLCQPLCVLADVGLPSSASRSALRAAVSVTAAPSIRWVAARSGQGPDLVDGDGDVVLQGAVAGGVVWGVVLPALPHDAAPGAADGADRAWVVVAAGAGGGVAVGRPGVPVAGAVRQRAERAAQPLVAAPAEAGGFAFAGLDRDRGLAGVGGERVTGGVARAAVADLGQQGRGGDRAVGRT